MSVVQTTANEIPSNPYEEFGFVIKFYCVIIGNHYMLYAIEVAIMFLPCLQYWYRPVGPDNFKKCSSILKCCNSRILRSFRRKPPFQ